MKMGILHCRRVGGLYDHRMQFGSLVSQELSGAKVEAELFIPVLFYSCSRPYLFRDEPNPSCRSARQSQTTSGPSTAYPCILRSMGGKKSAGLKHFAYEYCKVYQLYKGTAVP